VDGYFKNMRNKVFNSVQGDFQKEVEFSFGAAALTLSSVAVSISDAPDFTDDMVRKLDRIQIGVYKNTDWRNFHPDYNSLREMTADLRDEGYEFIVRSIQRDQMMAVMVKTNSDRLREMFVIAVDEEQMVMTQIFGDLDELIEIVLRSEGLNVQVAHN
jgi:hypothetical protein